MDAYHITYTHKDSDVEYSTWKISKSEGDAIKCAFGKAPKKNEKLMATKRGLIIKITKVEKHEVSEAFPISELPKREPAKGVSNNGDFML